MTKHWGILATFALAACSGHSIPSAGPASAELHVAPAFAPVRTTKIDPIAASTEFVAHAGPRARARRARGLHRAPQRVTADGLSTSACSRLYDGVKVWGSDIVVHHDGENITGVDGTLLGALTNLDLVPSLADTTATTMAKSDYTRLGDERLGGASRARESNELVVLPVDGGAAHLAWHVIFATDGTGGPGRHLELLRRRARRLHRRPLQQPADRGAEASGPGGNARVPRTWTNEPRRRRSRAPTTS